MQFPVLQYLDVVIGLAVVMIVVATFVTAITQFILSVTYARARFLRDGLSTLLVQLDPNKLGDHARYLAELALRDETVGSKKLIPWLTVARNWLTRPAPKALPAVSPASVVQREELILLLLQLMSRAGKAEKPADAKMEKSEDASGEALQQLLEAVKGSGTFDIAEELRKIQKEILNQETAHPKAAAATWRSAAIQTVSQKTTELHDFVAKVNAWYLNPAHSECPKGLQRPS